MRLKNIQQCTGHRSVEAIGLYYECPTEMQVSIVLASNTVTSATAEQQPPTGAGMAYPSYSL